MHRVTYEEFLHDVPESVQDTLKTEPEYLERPASRRSGLMADVQRTLYAVWNRLSYRRQNEVIDRAARRLNLYIAEIKRANEALAMDRARYKPIRDPHEA